jgi:cyclopropane fatty-acyl-phospholipid synthase-like methyltransferase
LDVGCSIGIFVGAALDSGFDAYGVELSSHAVAMAKETVRPRIIQADVNHHIRTSAVRYDVITAYDIVEHTQDPTAFVNDLYHALGRGGVLAITTPDTDHFLRYLMGNKWSMLQPLQHTFLFSKRSFKALLALAGFEDIEVEPARKTLTANYLFGQLSQTNPMIARLYKRISPIIPTRIGNAPLDVNIGEFFALARKP